MANKTLTPKKKQLTKNKINFNSLYTCGGKSGDILENTRGVTKKSIDVQTVVVGFTAVICL